MIIPRPLPRVIPRPSPAWAAAIFGPRIDPDAQAYIAAITAAGADLGLLNDEAITKKAISDSIIERKDLGIWELERRTYLPIWGVAAANAICQRSLESGEFVNSPTMAAGHVAFDGSTQFFDTKFNVASGGLTNASACNGCLWWDIGTNHQSGIFTAAGTTLLHNYTITPSVRSEICGSSRRYDTEVSASSDREGIFSANRRSGVTRHRIMRDSGISESDDFTADAAGVMPNGDFYWGARNRLDTSSVDQHGPQKMGIMWHALGLPDDLDEAFATNLKTLWKTCTDLTFPAP